MPSSSPIHRMRWMSSLLTHSPGESGKGGGGIVNEDRGDQQKTDRKRARRRLLYVKRNK